MAGELPGPARREQAALPGVSVVVPSHNPVPGHMAALCASLLAQTHQVWECVVVDDASTGELHALPDDSRFRRVRLEQNVGPAAARNRGARDAVYELLFFTDDDCTLHPYALESVARGLLTEDLAVGDTVTETRTWFGRCVALLGFPGGGSIGFHNVWRVEGNYTSSCSSCNLALRRRVFFDLGGFDESFPVAGGEDTIFARTALERGYAIRYLPHLKVGHVERESLRSFVRWQITRGRGNYHIRRKVGNVGNFLKMRLWSFGNSLRAAGWGYGPVVFLLIAAMVYLQCRGYRLEQREWEG